LSQVLRTSKTHIWVIAMVGDVHSLGLLQCQWGQILSDIRY
jgi:hypothetical protein